MVIDPTKSGLDNFIALISNATNRVFDPRYLNFTLPQSFSHSRYPTVNSAVVVSAKPKGPYKGTTTFAYGRIDLGKDYPPVTVDYVEDFDYLAFKRNLINVLGLIYDDVDFDVSQIPVPDGDNDAHFHLVAKQLSYVYVGKLRITVSSDIPSDARLMEDGSPRYLESGGLRILEYTAV